MKLSFRREYSDGEEGSAVDEVWYDGLEEERAQAQQCNPCSLGVESGPTPGSAGKKQMQPAFSGLHSAF